MNFKVQLINRKTDRACEICCRPIEEGEESYCFKKVGSSIERANYIHKKCFESKKHLLTIKSIKRVASRETSTKHQSTLKDLGITDYAIKYCKCILCNKKGFDIIIGQQQYIMRFHISCLQDYMNRHMITKVVDAKQIEKRKKERAYRNAQKKKWLQYLQNKFYAGDWNWSRVDKDELPKFIRLYKQELLGPPLLKRKGSRETRYDTLVFLNRKKEKIEIRFDVTNARKLKTSYMDSSFICLVTIDSLPKQVIEKLIYAYFEINPYFEYKKMPSLIEMCTHRDSFVRKCGKSLQSKKRERYYYKDGTVLEYRERSKVLHREDGPAIENADGYKAWYINDKLHRENGPAIKYANGGKRWCINGKYHREDGPAVERANGYKEWYINGKRHREDGPAIEYVDGDKSWWLNGILYNKKDFEAKLKEVDNLPTIAKLTHPEQWIRKRVKNDQ